MTTSATDKNNNNALAHSIASSWAATNVDFSSPNDAAIEELKKLWNSVVVPLCSDSVDEAWWTRLVELHSEPQRAYHTLVHLQECISLLKVHKQSHNPIMVLSVLFHDAIYDPKSGTNEEDSARLFQEFSQDVKLQDDNNNLIETVERYILATKHHKIQENNQEDLALFLDIDMAVLGKQQTAYLHYAGLIRDEYNFVDRNVYCEKRAEILEQFLKAPKLYGSNAMSLALEQRARDNLEHEIVLLKAGVIPGET